MGRKKGEPAEPPVAKRVIEVITEQHFDKLIKADKSHRKQISELTGSLREKIAYAKDKQNLHTGAYAVIKRLERMEPEESALWLEHFNHMLDISGIQERADAVLKLDLGGEKDEGEETGSRKGPRGVVAGTDAAHVG